MTLLLLLLITCALTHAELADEMQEYERECLGEDKFPCMSGECIPQDKYCDGVIDCKDGADEDYCQNLRPMQTGCLGNDNFMCKDHKRCIPHSWMCNNVTDCDDGSDEDGCTNVDEAPNLNGTCIGFVCDGGSKCISNLWVCDGIDDCKDRTDESREDNCRHRKMTHLVMDADTCVDVLYDGERSYRCIDSSFCLPKALMCNGIDDCRDGSDEGPFCKSFHEMCAGKDNPCKAARATCVPERYGPTCVCEGEPKSHRYNLTTGRCDDVDECAQERPQCSQNCRNVDGHFVCTCEDGYRQDDKRYLCYAEGSEAMLFYTTSTEIRYLKVKSGQEVVVAQDLKQVHGVTYDGKYLYWVENAQGHRAIFRAELTDVQKTKKVLVSLGLEDPGDIAVDWMGGHIYFTDAERGTISACRNDGSVCSSLNTNSRHPKYVTLGIRYGKIFWVDYLNRHVIMWANMDGSQSSILVDYMQRYATSLALDEPNGRLYYVETNIRVIKLDDKKTYMLYEQKFQHPLAVAVFENTIYWSDWVHKSVFSADKVHGDLNRKMLLVNLSTPVYDMHVYHSVLLKPTNNPCAYQDCSHLCLVSVNRSGVCVCPYGMELNGATECRRIAEYRPRYLVVGGGAKFLLVELNALGNLETHTTQLDIGRLHAMAYDNRRDTLYIYDTQRKVISFVNMTKFSSGDVQPFMSIGLDDVVDMEYDYVTDTLYILDAGKKFVEAVSLRTFKRVLLTRFSADQVPLSFCLMPEYGRMLIALVDVENNLRVQIDTIGLNGEDRKILVKTGLSGTRVRLRYSSEEDKVYIADDLNGLIETIHPEGTGRETFRSLVTTLLSMTIGDNHLYWTDRGTKLYWTSLHKHTQTIRKINLSMFAGRSHLYVQATSPRPDAKDPLAAHPCVRLSPCSDVCLQSPHPRIARHRHAPKNVSGLPYTCHCTPGLLNVDGQCVPLAQCTHAQLYCHKGNTCVDHGRRCDGVRDCTHGEDEEFCQSIITDSSDIEITTKPASAASVCHDSMQFKCFNSSTCIDLALACDGTAHCPDGSDEDVWTCKTSSCPDNEFRCAVGSCIRESFRCDGDNDCSDGSDEIDCDDKKCGVGYYECRNKECIDLHKRCDGQQDCTDYSDEQGCNSGDSELEDIELVCTEEQYACALNRSICLPFSARCNKKVECPGGSDEWGCDNHCAPHELFECKQDYMCLNLRLVCDGHPHCRDASDETPAACKKANMTARTFRPGALSTDCDERFVCDNGQCIDWANVCDNVPHCVDGSDENGKCKTACADMSCEYSCQRTPKGGHCRCFRGLEPAGDGRSCRDRDECARPTPVCAQQCINVHASYRCACHHGYALRPDQRSCKAAYGELSLLYVTGNTVWSATGGKRKSVYNNPNTAVINAIATDVRKGRLYVTVTEAGKLIEVNETATDVTITNIGKPTKVSVDWITGNVYFVDSTPGASCIRVCNVALKRCARLHKLPDNARVTALAVDPPSGQLFYCVSRDGRAVVWSASLAGRRLLDVTSANGCAGLAVDSFARRLYVAEDGHSRVISMDYMGEHMRVALYNRAELPGLHDIALFEDSLYFLANQTLVVTRCPLFPPGGDCEPVLRQAMGADGLLVHHGSAQRDDVTNPCEGARCDNVCVMSPRPACVCDDGSITQDGGCPLFGQEQLPLFNGRTLEQYRSTYTVLYVVLGVATTLLALYLAIYTYYRYKRRRAEAAAYLEVRYHNVSVESAESTSPAIPLLPLSATGGYEFVNPLQMLCETQEYKEDLNRSFVESSEEAPVPQVVEKPTTPLQSLLRRDTYDVITPYSEPPKHEDLQKSTNSDSKVEASEHQMSVPRVVVRPPTPLNNSQRRGTYDVITSPFSEIGDNEDLYVSTISDSMV